MRYCVCVWGGALSVTILLGPRATSSYALQKLPVEFKGIIDHANQEIQKLQLTQSRLD